MTKANTSLLDNALIWLGASISIAEMLTGTQLASLGFGTGMLAVLIGHAIGCILLYLVGMVGARKGISAMDSTKLSFGQRGSVLFSGLNVVQLVGWTAVMVVSGAAAAATIAPLLGQWFWCAVIGGMILIWVALGFRNASKVNAVACVFLFALTMVLSVVVFGSGSPLAPAQEGVLSFGGAVELAVAMPLSWLPLIADYASEAKRPIAATRVSVAVYFVGSCWMFAIGLGAALFAGSSDIAQIAVNAGVGVVGLLVMVFSTVTTTFLDVHSAGVSVKSIFARANVRVVAIAVAIVGTLLAIFVPVDSYQDFLYLIGSVFAPMAAILIIDVFVLKVDHSGKRFDWVNLALWAVGFVIYRLFMLTDLPTGYTLPTIVVVMALALLVGVLRRRCAGAVEKENA